MSVLPIELYHMIFENLDRSSLFELLLVSKPIQLEAERIIHCTIHFYVSDNHYSVCSLVRFLDTPRFFRHVRSLRIDMDGMTPEFPSLIQSLLRHLSHLKALIIRIMDDKEEIRSIGGDILRDCDFQLEVLHCPFALDQDFSAFLSKQDMLNVFLWAPYSLSSSPPSFTAFRTIKTLEIADCNCHSDGAVSTSAALDIISQCDAVSHLSWSIVSIPPNLPSLVSSATPLTALRIALLTDSAVLQSIPHLFPRLEYLGEVECNEINVEQFRYTRTFAHLMYCHQFT
jgi:hypothetical protein